MSATLGVMVSAKELHAVLLERTEEGTVARAWFSRSFGDDGGAPAFSGAADMGEEFGEEEEDVTIQFGDDTSQGGEMFVGSEFDDLSGDAEGAERQSPTFELKIEDILKECEARGYVNPEVAFCSAASGMDELELRLPPEEGESGSEGAAGLSLPASTDRLFEKVEEQYDGHAEKERVGFVPMHPAADGRHRVLALIAQRDGSVLSTLRKIKDNSSIDLPKVRLFESETTTYLGLARTILDLPPGGSEETMIVRTNKEDTLVLFMKGNTLHQAERLPSLNAEDPPDTICSRVLLLQDEYGIDDIQHVLLVGDEGEDELVDGFQEFFPDAPVAGLRGVLPSSPKEKVGGYVAATGAALRQLDHPRFAQSFQDVNFLPKEYVKWSFDLPVGWRVPALLVLLFFVSLGFVWYSFYNASKIDQKRSQLRALEQQIEDVDQNALQAHINDLNAATQTYSDRMEVVNTLLEGNNRWSKGLDSITGQISAIGGVAVESWSPQGANTVELNGHATARPRIVRLAEQLDGHIRSVTFTEIREWPLYAFTMSIPLDNSIPEGVQYWRDQRMAEFRSGGGSSSDLDSQVASASSSSTGGVPTDQETGSSSPPDISPPEPGWTVVVASLGTANQAEEFAYDFRNRLADYDHSLHVWEDQEGGRFRVGVGMFETFEAAEATRERMNEVLPSDAWTLETSTSTLASSSIRPDDSRESSSANE